MEYIDIHAHVNVAAFRDDHDEVTLRSLENDVAMINIGTQYDTSKRAVDMLSTYPKGVYATVGLHPIHVTNCFFDMDELEKENGYGIGKGEEADEEEDNPESAEATARPADRPDNGSLKRKLEIQDGQEGESQAKDHHHAARADPHTRPRHDSECRDAKEEQNSCLADGETSQGFLQETDWLEEKSRAFPGARF